VAGGPPTRSDPVRADAASIDRFHVWLDGVDQYDHEQLAQNWDRLDAIIGRPVTNGAGANNGIWPPVQGAGGGLYAQINLLIQARNPLGEVIDWFYPATSGVTFWDPTWGTAQPVGSVKIPDGFAVCDGHAVAKINHGYDSIPGVIYTPNLVNTFIMGANPTKPAGTPAPANEATTEASANGNANPLDGRLDAMAPGMVLSSVTSRRAGEAGKNLVKSLPITIPDHFHYHDHVHEYGRSMFSYSGDYDTIDDSNEYFNPQTDTAGSTKASKREHEHKVRTATTSRPWDPTYVQKYTDTNDQNPYKNGAQRPPVGSRLPGTLTQANNIRASLNANPRTQTTLQVIAAPINKLSAQSDPGRQEPLAGAGPRIPGTHLNGSNQSDQYDSNLGGSFDLDKRPHHVGLLKLMRVKHPTVVTDQMINLP
jgi:hypothetical protein